MPTLLAMDYSSNLNNVHNSHMTNNQGFDGLVSITPEFISIIYKKKPNFIGPASVGFSHLHFFKFLIINCCVSNC